MGEPAEPRARILLAEDYDDARQMYVELLEYRGFEVVAARNGQEALDHAARERFDLVILDIALPKVDGVTVIKTLRSRSETKPVPIISLSALVGEGMHEAIVAAGADLALDKPCTPDELEAAVTALLAAKAHG